ncbi:MAG TPA: DUF2062 domain-containing protein [Thermoanaerobaculia bacterium]|nr:DUF2062 domain-containing protein [Thermoanaerobaculia bacterium]
MKLKSGPHRGRSIRELLYRLRTEGDTPGRIAGAVGVGVFIGCSPFYGFHLALCILFAKIFRLNQFLTYLAAHVSLPGLWPLLVIGELQLGRFLRGAPLLSIRPADLRHTDPWQFAADLLLGSAVVGAVLAVAFALPTLWLARRRRKAPEINALRERTAYRYLAAGMFHWEFTRGKLRYDPVYFALLRAGALPDEGRLLDLGCGRGLLLALLLTAREQADKNEYPEGWPPPPRLDLHGIESSRKIVDVARRAVGGEARIDAADLRDTPDLPPARVILLLDVLHYLPDTAQEDLLVRIAEALEPGGLLLIRDADADAGWRFTATRIQERTCALVRRQWRQRFHYRSQAEWMELLERNGLAASTELMAQGTPYSNVLLAGRKGGSSPGGGAGA